MKKVLDRAMVIRGIMVTMVHSEEMKEIKELIVEKDRVEKKLISDFQMVKGTLSGNEEFVYLKKMEGIWSEFSQIKDKNAQFMLEGKGEKARSNLKNNGCHKIIAFMDTGIELINL